MGLLTCGYMIYPLQLALYQIYNNVDLISWQLPIKVEFPWDISTGLGYGLAYILVGLNILWTLLYCVALDTFFFGVILHISACFQDLRKMITEIDTIVSSNDDNVSLVQDRFLERKLYLIKCVKLHNLALDFVKKMEEIISSSLFVAYVIIIFVICAVLFQASEHMKSSQITRDLTFVFSALIQLLVSTYFGSLITQTSESICFAVYSTQWYRQIPKIRYFYHLILLRSQKPVHITALGLLNSSLKSFTKVISGSTRAFTLLQTMQDKRI
ncbi:putative odorant receptor 85d [Phlebotomus papatasi]|uniref:putative odorant receptor 85d n=1 Tax=Phlebotomus papatasi TaxID=29031 RepID=UPI002483DD69|nr:putative odorant receptor 85d [Phlebotomus papatasi]